MKRKMLALLLCTSMAVTMMGCAGDGSATENTSADNTVETKNDTSGEKVKTDTESEGDQLITEDITINIRAMNQYTNLDRILDKYYELVADDPNLSHVKLNFHYVTGSDYMDKLTTAIVAQEDIDLLFVGSWQGRTDYVKDGVFKDVSAYFEDEENYPGLATYFSDNILNAPKYEGGLYYIPLGAGEDLRGICYREDLRKEYGCDEIKDEETLKAYLETIQSHIDDGSLDMNVAWGITEAQGFMTFRNLMFEAPAHNIFIVNAGIDFYAYVDDNNKVVNAVVMGDDESQFAGFPEGYDYDFITENFAELTDWMPYCNNAIIEGDDYVDFTKGQCAATYHCISELGTAINSLQQYEKDAEVGFYVFDEAQRNMEKGGIPSTLLANNSVAIPAWSSDEKTTAVMCFLDALYGRKDINNLFCFGVEGEDYTVSDDGLVQNALRTSEDPDYYFYPTYSLVYTPHEFSYYYDWAAKEEKLKAYFDYQSDMENSYVLTKDSGFLFNSSNVEIEKAAISGVAENYKFNFGTYETKEATYEKAAEQYELLQAAGLETVRAEIISQMQAFFDAK